MSDKDKDQLAAEAHRDARKFGLKAHAWRVVLVVVSVAYWVVSKEPVAERTIMTLIAALSIQALVISEEGKAEAALSRAAGYENPS